MSFIDAVRRAASSAGDASGNCDSASYYAQRGYNTEAAQALEWAEENAKAALARIRDARAAMPTDGSNPR